MSADASHTRTRLLFNTGSISATTTISAHHSAHNGDDDNKQRDGTTTHTVKGGSAGEEKFSASSSYGDVAVARSATATSSQEVAADHARSEREDDAGQTHPDEDPTTVQAIKAAALAKALMSGGERSKMDKKRRKEEERRENLIMKQKHAWEKIIEKYHSTGYLPARTKLENLGISGIPSAIRHRAWPVLIGNKMQVTPELFGIFRERAKWARERVQADQEEQENASDEQNDEEDNTSHGSVRSRKNSVRSENSTHHGPAPPTLGREESIRLIETDLERTFPSLAFFKEGGPLHEPLRDILETFVSYRPDVGYVQGMSYLGGMLLLNVGDTPTCFQCLANMLASSTYFDFYRLDMAKMREHLRVFDYFFAYHIPVLHAYFSQEGVMLESSILGWILTLFSNVLPLDIAARIWDYYFCSTETVVWTIALALLKMLELHALQSDFSGIMNMLRRPPEYIEWSGFFDVIDSVKIDEKKFHDLLFKVKNGTELKPPTPKTSSFKYASYAPAAAAAATARSNRLRSVLVNRSLRPGTEETSSTATSEEVPESSIGMLASTTKSKLKTWKDKLIPRAHTPDSHDEGAAGVTSSKTETLDHHENGNGEANQASGSNGAKQ
eukprot:gb/GECG01016705.1/.p1 GENE.gb/GECG01016705.1/~~gb/GECG01016705.1/.p1  ORF type:complete len:613 (+),score=76.86 gb/GECG01016705.1/:1-1839(+)